MSEVFDTLNAVNVNEHTEIKETGGTKLTYLSWAWAWAEVKKRYPDATYTIWTDENHKPYILDPETGYMVFTSVTIDDVTHEMWLPVMDGANHAMKNTPYTVKTKYREFQVGTATMMDINKTIMRCLTKNLAMFGLGLYIYAGEDLPEGDQQETEKPEPATAADPLATRESICDACGKPITEKTFPNGKKYTKSQIIQKGKEMFGMKYCWACLYQANKAKEAKEAIADYGA